MKKTFLAILLLLPVFLQAQSPGFRYLSEKYAGAEGYTTIELNGPMLRMMNPEAGDEGLSTTLNNIKSMLLLVSEASNDSLRTDVKTMLDEIGYKRLCTSRNSEAQVEFYCNAADGDEPPSEYIMILYGSDGDVIMSLTGDIDLKQITSLSRLDMGAE